ncbi:MAG: nickel pincer cofactor biosynthesis protein LarB [Candidatus Latescibacteria bacterium]|nr:nickel pincer cofactor biosynthesis protein LarB [Candidatus Latescibacterota bacterium]
MTPEQVRQVLEAVRKNQLDVDGAMDRLKKLPFEDLGFAHVDHHRAMRQGFPEVIFCQGKTTEHVVEIARRISEAGSALLATRANREQADAVRSALPEADYNALARTLSIRGDDTENLAAAGEVLVISAGTSDMPVAEEAFVTADAMGSRVNRLYDVGVAGIHRLFAHREQIDRATAIVVVAGMEGALPSVVGGLVDVPVIAVPTSVGYGASFGGLAALLGTLNSCAPGVAVVNIDNGFGAGFFASLVTRTQDRSGRAA